MNNKTIAYALCLVSYFVFTPDVYNQGLDHRVTASLKVVAVVHDETALNGAHDIEIRDGIAYVVGKNGSITTMDVKDPAQPRILWSVCDSEKFDEAETVMPLDPDRLLIGTRDVLLFDVANPAQPRLLDKIEDRKYINRINGFARRGDIVFGANKDGYIFAVDVSAPDRLNLVGTHETRESGELFRPHDVAFSGDLLVVVSPEEDWSSPGRLVVYRVFHPASGKLLPSKKWKIVGQIEHLRLAGVNRVMIQGNLACTGNCSSKIDSDMRRNVSVVDLTNPGSPRLRGSLDFPDPKAGPNGLEWIGNTAFASGGKTVQAIDFSNPDKPQQRAVLSPEAFLGAAAKKHRWAREDDAHDLVLVGDYLFVTSQSSRSLVVIRVIFEKSR